MLQVESPSMKGLPRQTQSILAAGLLAILTLSVFSRAQFGGPESALRAYHVAVASGDEEAIRVLVLRNPEGESARRLQSLIGRMMTSASSAQILGVRRVGRDATLDVVYESQEFGTVALQFYVKKPGGSWQIDAEATWSLASRL